MGIDKELSWVHFKENSSTFEPGGLPELIIGYRMWVTRGWVVGGVEAPARSCDVRLCHAVCSLSRDVSVLGL